MEERFMTFGLNLERLIPRTNGRKMRWHIVSGRYRTARIGRRSDS